MTPPQASASGCSTGLEKHPCKDGGSLASRKEPLTCMHDLRHYHGLAHAVTCRHGHNPILGRGQLPHRTVQKKSGAPHYRISGPPPPRSVEQTVKINRAAQAGQHLNTFTTQPHRPWCRRKLKRRRCLWCRRFHGDRWFWRASPAATFRANISRASRCTVVSGRSNESQKPPSSRSWLKGKEVCKKGAGTRSVFQSMTSPKPAPLAPAFGSSAGSVRLVCSQPFVRF